MNLDKIVDALIKEAQARGDFDNLPGKGKPIDLAAYFNTPEDVRNAYSMLKNAGMIRLKSNCCRRLPRSSKGLGPRTMTRNEAGFKASFARNNCNSTL